MIIYEAYYDDGDYYNPIQEVGIYNDLNIAKAKAEECSQYADDVLFVRVMELRGNEFVAIELWTLDKLDKNPEWKIEELF